MKELDGKTQFLTYQLSSESVYLCIDGRKLYKRIQ